jgi:methionyl-tRNA synthetase
VIKFVTDQFGGVVPESGDAEGVLPTNDDEADPTFVSEVNELLAEYIESMESVKLRHSLNLVMSVSARGNLYLQRCSLGKILLEKDRKRCGQVLSRGINLIYALSALVHPFMPSTSDAILRQLNAPARVIPSVLSTDILVGHKLGAPELLFALISDSKAEEWRQKFGGAQKAVDAAVADNVPPMSKKKQAAAAKAAKAAKAAAPSVPKTPQMVELEVKIKTQGERVRAIKEGKALEGETLDAALAELLALKASLKDVEAEAAGALSAPTKV